MHRSSVRVTLQAHGAAHGHDGQVAGGNIRPWSVLTKRCDSHVNDARVGLPHSFKSQPLLGHLTGPGRFDYEVGFFSQSEQRITARFRLQVQGDTAFVAVEGKELQASLRFRSVFQERTQRPAW